MAVDEKELIYNNYIINLYNDLEHLMVNSGGYFNLMINLQRKYKNWGSNIVLEEDEDAALMEQSNIIRILVFKIHNRIKAIIHNLNIKETENDIKKLSELKEKIFSAEKFLDNKSLEEYIELANKIYYSVFVHTEIREVNKNTFESLSK